MRYFVYILIVLTISSTQREILGQWESEYRLTNNPATSYTPLNNGKCIASIGNFIHIVWYDTRDGHEEIYYKRSTDRGNTWSSDIRLSNNLYASWYPSITVSGSNVMVVWSYRYDNMDNWEIYYKNSTDGGITWGTEVRITNNSEPSRLPSIFVNTPNVYIVWYQNLTSQDIYFIKSTNMGLNWLQDTNLVSNPSTSLNPTISGSGSNVYVAWYDYRISGSNSEIYFKNSTNAGISWSSDLRLTNSSGNSLNPQVQSNGSNIYLAWYDDRTFSEQVYFKKSSDYGTNWTSDFQLTASDRNGNPSIAIAGNAIHMVWYTVGSITNTFYKYSIDNGITWSTNLQLNSDTAVGPSRPSISFADSSLYVAWCDYRDGNWEIYFKRNPNGIIVNNQNQSNELTNKFSLSQNYPNPFNPTTKIQFALTKSSFATLVVYDVLGRELETLVSEQLNVGTYEADWSADKFSSGVYYYKLVAGDFAETKKMVLMK